MASVVLDLERIAAPDVIGDLLPVSLAMDSLSSLAELLPVLTERQNVYEALAHQVFLGLCPARIMGCQIDGRPPRGISNYIVIMLVAFRGFPRARTFGDGQSPCREPAYRVAHGCRHHRQRVARRPRLGRLLQRRLQRLLRGLLLRLLL